MHVDRFWDVVKEIDWATRQSRPIEEGQRFLRQRLSAEEIDGFEEQLRGFRTELYAVLTDFEEDTGEEIEAGDDGLDDLICHIIGLGRREYDAVIANPRLAMERAASQDYKESFRYLVQSPADHE